MKLINTSISDTDREILTSMSGKTWKCFHGNQIDYENSAWDWVVIETAESSVMLINQLQLIELENEVDDYTSFSLRNLKSAKELPNKKTKPFFHGQNEVIEETWLVQDTIRGIQNNTAVFEIRVDRAIVFKLKTMWISFSKDAVWSEAISIDRGMNREQIELRSLEDEWPSDLLETYEFKREWVKL